jgi:TonB-dependent starch-binding outer membrane protein SusC
MIKQQTKDGKMGKSVQLHSKFYLTITGLLAIALFIPFAETADGQELNVISAENLVQAEVENRQFMHFAPAEINEKSRSALNKIISMDIKNVPMEDVLKQIAEFADLRLAYSREVNKAAWSKPVSLQIDRATVLGALYAALGDTGLRLTLSSDSGYGQVVVVKGSVKELTAAGEFHEWLFQETVTGRVLDAETGESLPGVNIVLKGTTSGTASDVNGDFSVSVPSLNDTLVFSYIGYQSQEVPINERTNLEVSLLPAAILGDELVVIGYGQVRKSDLTGSTAIIGSEQIQESPSPNLFDRIQGRISGLTVNRASYAAGSDPEILVRGINSLSADNTPLIILDGIPFDGALSRINPNDIESISVLKDASSTAIYGARGSNGVILVTTKSGRRGELNIDYEGRVGTGGYANRINVLDADGYVQFKQDRARILGETNLDPANLLNSAELEMLNNGHSVDWQDLMSRNALMFDHQLGVSGGSENTTFYIALNQMDQNGIVRGNDYTRTSLQFNGTYNITDWLEFGTNSRFSWEDFGNSQQVNVEEALKMSPLAQVYNDDGSLTTHPINPDTFFGNPLRGLDNPIKQMHRTSFINLYSDIEIPWLDGLAFRIQYGNTTEQREFNRYFPTNSFDGMGTQGRADRNNGLLENWTLENLLTYRQDFGRNRVEFTGLFSRQHRSFDQMNVRGDGFINDALNYYGIGGAGTLRSSSSVSEWDMLSYMGRLNYVFDDRYFLTLTVRTDGYSGFGVENKYGTFPSAALAWNISEEEFFQNLGSPIEFMKLRLSYGVNGNQAIPPYRTLSQISAGNDYVFDNTAHGFYPNTIGNASLAWESTSTLNAGIDFELLSPRITGSIDYYFSQSDGLLLERRIPTMTGFNSIWDNVAITENRGLEINISPSIIRGQTFSWNADLNFSLNRNKIVQLFEDNVDDIGNRWFIGQPVRSNFDYVIDGVWQLDDDIENSHMPDARPGEFKLRDVNNDGVLTADDRTIIGNELPDYTLGFSSNFAYRNLSLSFFIYSEQGITRANTMLDTDRWYRRSMLDIDFWTLDNPTNAYPANFIPGSNPYNVDIYEDASYIKLQNVTLAYDVSRTFLDQFNIRNLRLFVTGDNLLTLTDWTGYDPSVRSTWYPSVRSVTFGLNVGL